MFRLQGMCCVRKVSAEKRRLGLGVLFCLGVYWRRETRYLIFWLGSLTGWLTRSQLIYSGGRETMSRVLAVSRTRSSSFSFAPRSKKQQQQLLLSIRMTAPSDFFLSSSAGATLFLNELSRWRSEKESKRGRQRKMGNGNLLFLSERAHPASKRAREKERKWVFRRRYHRTRWIKSRWKKGALYAVVKATQHLRCRRRRTDSSFNSLSKREPHQPLFMNLIPRSNFPRRIIFPSAAAGARILIWMRINEI